MRRPPNRGRTAQAQAVPAPIGGLNTKDALSAMAPQFASVMENLFPYSDRVETRYGYATHATASSIAAAAGEEGFRALMKWEFDADPTVFAAFYWIEDVGGSRGRMRIYSVAANGTLTTSKEVTATGTTETTPEIGEWTQHSTGSGTTYLIVASGYTSTAPAIVNQPLAYDGSSWTSPSITGAPSGAIARGVHSHQRRLWFYDWTAGADPLRAYYLPANAIAGALKSFDLSPYATKGGKIVAMRTWATDGGDGGVDDLAVFVTSAGQAIVYQGIDPSSFVTWRLIGVFDIGLMASYLSTNVADGYAVKDAFALKYGADVLFLTSSGLTAASRVLAAIRGGEDVSLSRNIRPSIASAASTWLTFSAASSTYWNTWRMAHFKRGQQVVITIPTAITEVAPTPKSYQLTTTWYVMNTETGAWTKFSGLNAWDILDVGSLLYFIDGTRVIYKYGAARTDDGATITFEGRQAYNYFGAPNKKLATLMQPMLRATSSFNLKLEADVDFNGGTISAYSSYTVSSEQNLQPTFSPAKFGTAFAAHLKGQTTTGGAVVSWYATNWMLKPAELSIQV